MIDNDPHIDTPEEIVRFRTEYMIVKHVFEKRHIMTDDDSKAIGKLIQDIHNERLNYANAINDLDAIRFYASFDNRYDYIHKNFKDNALYKKFLLEVDILNLPKTSITPLSILDINLIERVFYIAYIDLHQISTCNHAEDRSYTERDAICDFTMSFNASR